MDDGIGYADFMRMLIALIFVLALILSGLYLAKKFGRSWGLQHIPIKKRRLKVLESVSLGPKQRLIIIKRDDTEHVIIVSHDNATLIESNIKPLNNIDSGNLKDEIG